MKHQNYSNHVRYVPMWHVVTSSLLLASFVGSIVLVFQIEEKSRLQAVILVMLSLVLLSIFWYARWFALRAQDRAIRAEENLRHFALTGKLLDPHLRTSQIIALRFASDQEFVELAEKAAKEQMRSNAIKKAIKHWRSDHHRV